MNEERIYQLLGYLTNNNINAEDYDELMGYLAAATEDAALQSAIDRMWAELSPAQQLRPEESDALYQQITGNARFVQQPIHKKRRWLSYAAAILLLLATGASAYLLFTPTRTAPVAYRELSVPAGQRQQLKLADGSTVWLKGGSTLRYPASFTGNTRELFLHGEGYFDVTHRDNQPFLVHTGSVTTKVLGTAFNIQAYDQQLTVAVVNGKVSVAEGNTALGVVVANQLLEYHPQNKQVALRDTIAGNMVAWTKGELILDNVTMEEAAVTIGKWYNVAIVFADPELKKSRFSFSFLHGENIGEVMNMISQLNGFSYHIEGNIITISQKKPLRRQPQR
ncbi:FecR family protein [Chitinophaga sp. CF418]|uniref:FecR family protein n=1 Tax=Chitinophaga sp. CF418 TaxID=1855287 RepID=UPI0009186072|nr:FecR domain-containing protein [Chitinophaga sp. CF418]SHN43956.1 FecR family protein [Chitinophaga sp. CF418]